MIRLWPQLAKAVRAQDGDISDIALQHVYEKGRMAGRREERACTVAWLHDRAEAEARVDPILARIREVFASTVARGEHLQFGDVAKARDFIAAVERCLSSEDAP